MSRNSLLRGAPRGVPNPLVGRSWYELPMGCFGASGCSSVTKGVPPEPRAPTTPPPFRRWARGGWVEMGGRIPPPFRRWARGGWVEMGGRIPPNLRRWARSPRENGVLGSGVQRVARRTNPDTTRTWDCHVGLPSKRPGVVEAGGLDLGQHRTGSPISRVWERKMFITQSTSQ